MNRKNLLKWFGMFFVVMLLFTVLSRASDSVNVARVSVSGFQNQIIVHEVRGSGKILGTKETAVFAPGEQRVGRILVREGQTVQEGDLLFVLEEETMLQRIQEKRTEIQEQKWKLEDLKSAAELNGEKKEQALKRAEENYETTVKNGEINLANARMELDVAKQKLQIYFNSVAYDSSRRDGSREQSLRDEIRSREEAVVQLIMTTDQETREAERALEDAKMDSASDSSLSTARRELKKLRRELKELRTLKKEGGEICAPVKGVVKSVSVSTGSFTGEEAAMVLYETEGDLRMTGSIPAEDLTYVASGDGILLKGSSGKTLEDGVVETIGEDEKDSSVRNISVTVPEGTFSIGESVDFTVSKKSGPYHSCIPLSGLYAENNQNYVYVIDTENTVLGEVLTARRVDVKVLDKNERTAALEEGSLSSDQKIIVGSSRLIEDGSRVRLVES